MLFERESCPALNHLALFHLAYILALLYKIKGGWGLWQQSALPSLLSGALKLHTLHMHDELRALQTAQVSALFIWPVLLFEHDAVSRHWIWGPINKNNSNNTHRHTQKKALSALSGFLMCIWTVYLPYTLTGWVFEGHVDYENKNSKCTVANKEIKGCAVTYRNTAVTGW